MPFGLELLGNERPCGRKISRRLPQDFQVIAILRLVFAKASSGTEAASDGAARFSHPMIG